MHQQQWLAVLEELPLEQATNAPARRSPHPCATRSAPRGWHTCWATAYRAEQERTAPMDEHAYEDDAELEDLYDEDDLYDDEDDDAETTTRRRWTRSARASQRCRPTGTALTIRTSGLRSRSTPSSTPTKSRPGRH